MSRTASSRTAASGLDKPKCASVVCNVRRRWLLVPILVKLSDGAEPASFSVSGSIRSSVADPRRRVLTMKNFLIAVAVIETVFEQAP